MNASNCHVRRKWYRPSAPVLACHGELQPLLIADLDLLVVVLQHVHVHVHGDEGGMKVGGDAEVITGGEGDGVDV